MFGIEINETWSSRAMTAQKRSNYSEYILLFGIYEIKLLSDFGYT